MKQPNKAESLGVVGFLAKIILSILILGFAGLAIHNIRTLRVELDNSSSNFEELQNQSEQDIKNLETENKNLNDEKAKLEQEKKELEEKLQAKLDAQKKAQEQAKLASTKVSIPGTCKDWMTQAGITDMTNAYFIFQKESNCNPTATNKSSGAYGVCQSLPGSKMASAGSDWQTNPVTQMKWCQSYAQSRYGSWSNAVAFWNANKWW